MMRPVRRRHLPSLGALATFEVAAKHLSFTLAAGLVVFSFVVLLGLYRLGGVRNTLGAGQ